jgi:hypothetical protein
MLTTGDHTITPSQHLINAKALHNLYEIDINFPSPSRSAMMGAHIRKSLRDHVCEPSLRAKTYVCSLISAHFMSVTRLADTIYKIKNIIYLPVGWSLRGHVTDMDSLCAPHAADIFICTSIFVNFIMYSEWVRNKHTVLCIYCNIYIKSATSIGGQPIKKCFAITWCQ